MLDRSLRRFSWALLLALPALAQPPSPEPDPILWPEPQRQFWQDGPALLLSEEQRTAFLALDEAGRERFIQELLDRDPLPETPANELRQGIERRGRLVGLEFASPQDVRSQLLFLKGRPVRRTVVDCAATFRPLEVWTYADGKDAALRDLIVYQPSADEPFRLWLPIDSKAALYVEEMIYWLQDMEKVRLGGKRLDRYFCPDAELVDRVTGVEGLYGRPAVTVSLPRSLTGEPETRVYYHWADPQNRAAMLEGPRDLASWARAAALTPLPELPPLLAIGKLEMDFPRWQGQRLVARALLTLPLPFGMEVLEGQDGPRVRLTVDGVVEREGRIFEDFRLRYQLPPPGPDAPGALLLERQLRPGQSFLLRLKVKDPATGAEGTVVRGFRVPDRTVQLLPASLAAGASAGEAVQQAPVRADTLLLIPPAEEVVLGTWRADTVVSGGRIEKVGFLVDGKLQVVRSRPPFSAEIRLATFPREQLVRVEGYDENGALVAADQMLVNQARGGFRVRITEPRRGARATGEVPVRAEVTVPEERKVQAVELRVNDALVATLESPPWEHRIEVPASGGEIAYLTVTALLDDGSRAEDVRFLRAPANLDEVEVNLVELFATVLDGDGRPVRGLAAEDFQVSEAGEPQTLARFEQVDNLPLSLGIAIDTSFSMASSLDEAERAAMSFLRGVMKPGDRCFALAITSRPELLIPPVDDPEAVFLALEGLRSFGRTAFHDAVIASLYHFRAQRGQRALILLTDGEDTGSATSWADVREYARRSGVAIYAVGLNVPVLKRAPRARLEELARVSGGRAFFVEHAHELAGVYGQIEAELRSRYFLAYHSSQPADENGFRRIQVKARRGLEVRAGRGYVP